MATTVPGVLSKSFRDGFREIIEIVEPGIDKLVEIETAKIAQMPKAAQDEIYSRFAALFDKGITEPNKDGLALFKENKETGILWGIISEVSSDIDLAKKVLHDENKLEEAIKDGPAGFSARSKALIENEVGQQLNLIEQKSLIITAVGKIFGPMDFKTPVNSEPQNEAVNRKNPMPSTPSSTSSDTNGLYDAANGEPQKKATKRKHHARRAVRSTSSKTNGSHDAANGEPQKKATKRKHDVRTESGSNSSKTNGAKNDVTNGVKNDEVNEHKISKQIISDSDSVSLTIQTGAEPPPEASQPESGSSSSKTNSANTTTPRPKPTPKEIDDMDDIVGSRWLANSILSGMPFSMENEELFG